MFGFAPRDERFDIGSRAQGFAELVATQHDRVLGSTELPSCEEAAAGLQRNAAKQAGGQLVGEQDVVLAHGVHDLRVRQRSVEAPAGRLRKLLPCLLGGGLPGRRQVRLGVILHQIRKQVRDQLGTL